MIVKDIIEIISNMNKEDVIRMVLAGLTSLSIKKICDQIWLLPSYFITKIKDRKHKTHEYSGENQILEYWRDFLGPYFGMEPSISKLIHSNHQVIFNDVILSDWVPRAPGYYYTNKFWSNPLKTYSSTGTIRFVPNDFTGSKRLLSINKPEKYEAHASIERGIPLLVSNDVYKKISENIEKYGVVHVDKIITTLSDVNVFANYLEMVDIPSTFPVINNVKNIRKIGDPIPILGNGWIIYTNLKESNFLKYRFWTGINYYDESLKKSKDKLSSMIPKGFYPLHDFDLKIKTFKNTLLPIKMTINDIKEYIKIREQEMREYNSYIV